MKNTYKFDELVYLVISKLGVNYEEVVVKMAYSMDFTLFPIQIRGNNNVISYCKWILDLCVLEKQKCSRLDK